MSKAANSKETTEDELLELASQLQKKAESMLAWPLARTEIITDKASLSIRIEPCGWTKLDAVEMIKTAVAIESLVFSGGLRPPPEPDGSGQKPKPRGAKKPRKSAAP